MSHFILEGSERKWEVFKLPGDFIFKILINVLSESFGSIFFKRTNCDIWTVLLFVCFLVCFVLKCVLNSVILTKAKTLLLHLFGVDIVVNCLYSALNWSSLFSVYFIFICKSAGTICAINNFVCEIYKKQVLQVCTQYLLTLFVCKKPKNVINRIKRNIFYTVRIKSRSCV